MQDPTTKRARSVVTLVILTIAVPSLLLTALVAVAVENEEAAAKKRTETAYDPIVWDIAHRFNTKIDELVADSAEPFGEMVKRAQGEEVDEEKIEAFVKRTGDLAMNYFLIDPNGELLDPPVAKREQQDLRARGQAEGRRVRRDARSAGEPQPPARHVRPDPDHRSRRLAAVVVAQSIDGYFVGFELSACAFEPFLNQVLKEKNLDPGAHVELHPIQMPKEVIKKIDWHDYETRVLNWTLLKKSNLAWKMVILCDDQEGILSVTESRSTLYFWALILLAGALVAGIGYTIRTVSIEARLSGLKTDFVSNVSHDLRTPLTSIRMFTETLRLRRASSKEEEREFLQGIADETARPPGSSIGSSTAADGGGPQAYQISNADIRELVSQAMRASRPSLEHARAT